MKPSNKRNFFELQTITKMIENFDSIVKLKKEAIFNEFNLNKSLALCAIFLVLKQGDKDEHIYDQGDLSEEVYFVLKGKVKVMNIVQFERQMNLIEYLDYLKSQYLSGNINLVERSIKDNAKKYPLTRDLVEKLEEITSLIIVLDSILNLKIKYASEIVEHIGSKFEWVKELEKSNNSAIDIIEIFDELKLTLSELTKGSKLNEFIDLDYLRQSKKTVVLYEYRLSHIVRKGNFFGAYLSEKQEKPIPRSLNLIKGKIL